MHNLSFEMWTMLQTIGEAAIWNSDHYSFGLNPQILTLPLEKFIVFHTKHIFPLVKNAFNVTKINILEKKGNRCLYCLNLNFEYG